MTHLTILLTVALLGMGAPPPVTTHVVGELDGRPLTLELVVPEGDGRHGAAVLLELLDADDRPRVEDADRAAREADGQGRRLEGRPPADAEGLVVGGRELGDLRATQCTGSAVRCVQVHGGSSALCVALYTTSASPEAGGSALCVALPATAAPLGESARWGCHIRKVGLPY